jgi:ribosome-associated protein
MLSRRPLAIAAPQQQVASTMLRATKHVAIDHRQVQERFVHAMGPGGRHLNREATVVELRLDLSTVDLPREVLDRLVVLAGKSVTNDGVLVVVSRIHKSQARNREAARERLTELLERAAAPPKRRKTTKPRRKVQKDRITSKRMHGAVKRLRRTGEEDGD